jgi:isoleucyl-tRNA synthetase
MFKDAPPRVAVDELEHSILEYWQAEDIFARSLKEREGGERFTFYDGPPYATGKPHYGHVLQSALKDTVLRYKTMRGYYAPRRVGWDTHGLPVEVLVEKELGLKNKKDVEAFGIATFNEQCRATVFRYINEFQATLQRLGRWADYEHGYATLDRDYMESEWWAFKELWQKQLVYKDYRSTPYCIRCETPLSNFETGMGYKDRKDTAVYIKLKLKNQKAELLVWTTTPWTLPANVAVAFSPKLTYVTVRHEDGEYVVAKERMALLFGENAEVVKEWSPEELGQLAYEPLWPEVTVSGIGRVVPSPYVTADEGTGLVHEAPAFGADDATLAKQANLPTIRNVDTSGHYVADVAPSWLAGMLIWDATYKIIGDLKERGHLWKKEQYTHSYPHCWRCDQPLIYYALDSWFVRVTAIKQQMLAHNESINWIPAHIKAGRFAKGIESAPDWAVSRNRFWSTPIPMWECSECETRVCVGSVTELLELSGADEAAVADLHRPFVDDISWPCKECTGTMKRIPEVLDVWFDAGSMPYAQWHYPFANKELVEQNFPADFIVESIEMTRAWFYVLHVLSTALKDGPAYKNVIGSGIIFGEDGNKLSKKLKNYPEVEPTLEKFGADTVRMFFLNSTLGEPYVFSEKELQQLHRSLYGTLWNVYSFFVRYANTHSWQPPEKNSEFRIQNLENVLDTWIIARLTQLESEVIGSMDEYRTDNAARAFIPFVDDLSNWYVRRSRPRFQHPIEGDTAFATLYEVLIRFSKLLAPFMPFVTEDIYRTLTGEASVHLAALDAPPPISEEQKNLVVAMAQAREMVSVGLADRAKKGIKVRQPLQRLFIKEAANVSAELQAIICDEVNVKEITIDANIEAVAAVDGTITPELKQEGLAREIIRQGQVLRREADYALDDRITLVLVTDSAEITEALDTHKDLIMSALQADKLITEPHPADKEADLKINGIPVHLGVIR